LTVWRKKRLKTGASKLYIEDLKKDYIQENYISLTSRRTPSMRTSTCSAPRTPALHRKAPCRDCQGRGRGRHLPRLHRQGQRPGRFELTIKAFAPGYEDHRAVERVVHQVEREEIEYAEAHNIPLKINRETNYSKDKNIWHLSHEGLDLEDPANEPQYNKPGFLELGVSPEQAPDEPTYVTIHFEKGVPDRDRRRGNGAVEAL
jgi:argininosuccinate synthase